MREHEFDFVKTPDAILAELMHSKINGNAIGIYSPTLGEAMYITGVQDVIENDDKTVVILKPYDTTGYMLTNSKIYVNDIQSVCPFKSPVKNPYLENLERDKSWFF